MDEPVDLAIVGSGFAGSLLAMIAARLGLSTVLLERGTHPRFAIGESTAPLTNLLIEQIARRYDLPGLLPLTTYGAWKRECPQLTCGLKRGFSFYHHQAGKPFDPSGERENELLVAASPSDEEGDTHWYRAEVDHFLVQQAISAGVTYLDRVELTGFTPGSAAGVLTGTRMGEPATFHARLVVDASGPGGFMSRALDIPNAGFENYPRTQALFSHFSGVRRFAEIRPELPGEQPPYPPDAAALHHVFDGGWIWVLRFDNGVTSAGASVTPELAEELNLSEGEPAWKRLLARYPSIGAQFAVARPVRPFTHARSLPYRAATAHGRGWLMLSSAAAFVDPLFSTGFPLTLLGIMRLASLLEERRLRSIDQSLRTLAEGSLAEADWTAGLVGNCLSSFSSFPVFSALSMFYFASASFAEMALRLDRAELAAGFLSRENPHVSAAMRECEGRASSGVSRSRLESQVAAGIDPINVAGLCNPARKSWYPVDLWDVVRSAGKLRYSEAEMVRVLRDAPWANLTSAPGPFSDLE